MPDYLWVRTESRARRLALVPLCLAEGPYRAGAWLHRQARRVGLLPSFRLPARVVSVGNLTVGGSAKTPVVAWLAGRLHARGEKVAILSRGVRGARSGRVNVVSDGERVLLSPADVGDEPVWLASTLPGVPVLAGRNRVALGLRAAAVFGAEVLLLDDGFQHHRVARDLDLVCVDARAGLGNGHLLPRGPLRESPAVLRHAHAVLWTRCPADPGAAPADPRIPPGIPQFRARTRVRGLRRLGSSELQAPEALRGRRVGLLAAIARPDGFRRALGELGAEVARAVRYPDHHLYRPSEIQGLDAGIPWVTTGKDAVKLPASWAAGREILVLEEEVEPERPPALIEWVQEGIGARSRPR